MVSWLTSSSLTGRSKDRARASVPFTAVSLQGRRDAAGPACLSPPCPFGDGGMPQVGDRVDHGRASRPAGQLALRRMVDLLRSGRRRRAEKTVRGAVVVVEHRVEVAVGAVGKDRRYPRVAGQRA